MIVEVSANPATWPGSHRSCPRLSDVGLFHLNAKHLRLASITNLGHADHMTKGAFPSKATHSFLTNADNRYLRFVTWHNCHGPPGGTWPAVVDLRILVTLSTR